MSLAYWLANARMYYAHQPVHRATKLALGELANGVLRRVPLPSFGTPVFEHDWDVLVVLDACRVDLLRAVRDEYEWLAAADFGTTVSTGSNSPEWMETNFVEAFAGEMRETVHVTWNPHSGNQLDADDWLELDELWRTNWDDETGCVRPGDVTDAAIVRHRNLEPRRMLVHYQQPHQPYPRHDELFTGDSLLREEPAGERTGGFGRVIRGEVSREQLREAYRDNLRWALDEVGRLVSNVDADAVAVTADHGECLGEWGVYGHYDSYPVPPLRRVPWVTLSASDEGTADPDHPAADAEEAPVDVEERLAALGYV